MSSISTDHLRKSGLFAPFFMLCIGSFSQSALAQDAAPAEQAIEKEADSNPDAIDILVRPEDLEADPRYLEQCERDIEAGIISGEIIVCAARRDPNRYSTVNNDEAEQRYAEETAFRDDPRTPDFILDCHDQGNPAGCISIGKVPPPALIIDVAALPEAPIGSDADRIGRGLPPIGNDEGIAPIADAISRNGSAASGPITTGPVIDYQTPSLNNEADADVSTNSAGSVEPEADQ